MLIYNTTPHGTTGKTPTELMYGRNIRDKIPSITNITGEVIDEEAQDRDLRNKEKGNIGQDKARGAVENNITVGDKVIVKNVMASNKLIPNFGSEHYEVINRTGNELLLEGQNRVIRRRPLNHVKKVHIAEDTNKDTSNDQDTTILYDETPTTINVSDTDTADQKFSNTETQSDSPIKDSVPELTKEDQVKPLRLKKMEGMWRRIPDE